MSRAKKYKEFGRHLDGCERCRERCFHLCPEGLKLLQEAAGDLDISRAGLPLEEES